MSVESFRNNSARTEAQERPSKWRIDRGALMAGALFHTIIGSAFDAQKVEAQTITGSNVELVHSSEAEKTAETPVFHSYINSMILKARKASGAPQQIETASAFITAPDGSESIVQPPEKIGDAYIHPNYEALRATYGNGRILFCHTHPLEKTVAGMETERYAIPPSIADIEEMLQDANEFAIKKSQEQRTSSTQEFMEFIQRYQWCVTPPGSGYWRMTITDSNVALAWLSKEPEHKLELQERVQNLLAPLYQEGFFDKYDTDGSYRKLADANNVDELISSIQRDIEAKKTDHTLTDLQASELVSEYVAFKAFEERYWDYRQDKTFNQNGPEFAALNKVLLDITDTDDMQASETEYRTYTQEVLRLYGIKVDWVDFQAK